MSKIRTLRADEIECRVAQVKEGRKGVGCSLLLYKDARCDMAILDEVFGPLNWQREHVIINGNLYCNILVWDESKKQWVQKQDVGTESNTEKEKGQASDSFKRAGTNWGIGRELYTAPLIWIPLAEREYTSQNGKLRCAQSFKVSEIYYSESRKIDGIIIRDKNNNERFRYGNIPEEDPKIKAAHEKANQVYLLIKKINGNDKEATEQIWNEMYRKDADDIMKMNAALMELQERWKAVEQMKKELGQ